MSGRLKNGSSKHVSMIALSNMPRIKIGGMTIHPAYQGWLGSCSLKTSSAGQFRGKNMKNITDNDLSKIKLAEAKMRLATALMEEIDEILEPIVKAVVATDDIEQMKALVEILPPGFYRSELRVIISRN